MGPNSSDNYNAKSVKVMDLTYLRPALKDYFNIVIWDSLNQIVCEFPSDFKINKFKDMKTEICKIFASSIVSNNEDLYIEQEIKPILDKYMIKSDLIRQYIIETLEILRKQLLDTILTDLIDEGQSVDEVVGSLKNTVEEYILTSYFDKIILAQAVRPLLYNTRVSYAEINEFRLHLIDIFHEALHDKIRISQIKDYLDEKLNSMSEQQTINKLIIALIIGFFSTLVYHRNHESLIKEMEKRIDNLIIISGDLTFIESDSTTAILKWISYDIIDPILGMLESDESWVVFDKIDTFKSQVLNLYEMQLNRKLTLKSILGELKLLEKEYTEKAKKQGKNAKEKKLKAKYVDLGNQRFMIESNQQRTGFFFMILEFLATHLDEQLEADFKLTKITESIRSKEYKSFDQFYL